MAPQKDPSSPKQKRNGDSNSKKKDVKKIKFMTRKQANALVIDSGVAIQKALEHLEAARALAQRAGLSVDASIVPRVDPNQPGTLVDTGGHSNTDHVVLRTGDERKDRIAELKRNLLRRYRSMQPENRGEDRYVPMTTKKTFRFVCRALTFFSFLPDYETVGINRKFWEEDDDE